MRQRASIGLIAALAMLILAGCAGEAAEVPYASACNIENDGKNIAVVGYFQTRLSMYCSNTGGDYRCPLGFVSAPGDETDFTADLLEGDGRNQMSPIPDSYTDADIILNTDDGGTLGVGQRARISGKMSIVEPSAEAGSGVCFMTVDKIEAVTE